MIFVDPLFVMESKNAQAFRNGLRHGHQWCHMFADDPGALTNPDHALHRLALRIGLRREWFQPDRDGGHYDLVPTKRDLAVRYGAREVDRRGAVLIWRRVREALGGPRRKRLIRQDRESAEKEEP